MMHLTVWSQPGFMLHKWNILSYAACFLCLSSSRNCFTVSFVALLEKIIVCHVLFIYLNVSYYALLISRQVVFIGKV